MSKKNVIAVAIILVAVGALIYLGLSSSTRYAYTVGELIGAGAQEGIVRVQGIASDIEYAEGGKLGHFILHDEHSPEITLSVTYEGNSTPPNTFQEGAGATVEGYYQSQGIFLAQSILPLCASHYQPEEAGN